MLFYKKQKNEEDIAENKQSWKAIKLLLFGKIKPSNNTFLVEGDGIINEDDRNATVLNNLFNAITNLKIPEYSETDPGADNNSQSYLKTIFEYRKHPSIDAIKNITTGKKFKFLKVSIEDVMTEIKKLNTRKATQTLTYM